MSKKRSINCTSPNVNSFKTNRDVRQGMRVCSRITRLTNNRTKSRKRATILSPKTESDDKNAVAFVKNVPQLGCVSQDSDALISQRGKQSWETRCKKSWDRFEKYDSKHIQSQRERQGYILLARGRMGPPGCVNKRAGGKRVCRGFRS